MYTCSFVFECGCHSNTVVLPSCAFLRMLACYSDKRTCMVVILRTAESNPYALGTAVCNACFLKLPSDVLQFGSKSVLICPLIPASCCKNLVGIFAYICIYIVCSSFHAALIARRRHECLLHQVSARKAMSQRAAMLHLTIDFDRPYEAIVEKKNHWVMEHAGRDLLGSCASGQQGCKRKDCPRLA